jgi:hypothetical protein
MTDGMAAFIRARLDEQAEDLDQLIRYLDNQGDVPGMDGGWKVWGDFGDRVGRVADFQRMRRAVEAQRDLLASIVSYATETNHGREYADELLQIMASEWSDHQDYPRSDGPDWLMC